MNPVNRHGTRVVIEQVPVLLLAVTALFSLPFLAFSLTMILRGQDADGKIFCLFFGIFVLWVSLEFVATRERIEIEPTMHSLKRTVSGVFRHRRQTLDLREMIDITLESRMQSSGTKNLRRQHLYMNGRRGERFLLNSPAKVSLDHRKTAKILQEITGLPYREWRDGEEV